jgi:hypothetical protein
LRRRGPPHNFKRGDVAQFWGDETGRVSQVKAGRVTIKVQGGDTITGPARVFGLIALKSETKGAR